MQCEAFFFPCGTLRMRNIYELRRNKKRDARKVGWLPAQA